MSATASLTIREKQTIALKKMINLNAPVAKSTVMEPVWKVLIYDRGGQDIISPLLKVGELRDFGITLHLLLHSDRDPIPDVPAVYFVTPTEDNVKRIGNDVANGLYESYYLNFVSPVSRKCLEDLAMSCLAANCQSSVTKVFDQYLNFISLEDDMFVLKPVEKSATVSYYSLNRTDIRDTEMEELLDSVVDSLFSFFVTMGTVPVIRCPKGNAAEMVATKLDKKLRDNLRDSRNSLFTADAGGGGGGGVGAAAAAQMSFQRPLLAILDRCVDLATPLHHTWTYQALVHDVFNLKSNRVEIQESAPSSDEGAVGGHRPPKAKSYDLNPSDKFWQSHKGSPFPALAEAVQDELESYRASEDEVKKLKTAMGVDSIDEAENVDVGGFDDHTAKITSAVSSLPELLEKKRVIDMHMNIATAVLDQIKKRKLDMFFECEEQVMGKQALEKSVLETLRDHEAGSPEDRMRFFLIYYMCEEIPEADLGAHLDALTEAGCDLAPFEYVKAWKKFAKGSVVSSSGGQYGQYATKSVGMFSKLMSQGSSFVMEGVKNLAVKKHNLPVTRIVDALMELKSSPEVDDYRYFDPKLVRATDNASIPRSRSPFQESVVFVIGGGNYIEYQNLRDYSKSKGGSKRITYGCSDLMNAASFVSQLTQLGKDMKS